MRASSSRRPCASRPTLRPTRSTASRRWSAPSSTVSRGSSSSTRCGVSARAVMPPRHAALRSSSPDSSTTGTSRGRARGGTFSTGRRSRSPRGVTAADVENLRWRASETALPPTSMRFGPVGLAVALLAVGPRSRDCGGAPRSPSVAQRGGRGRPAGSRGSDAARAGARARARRHTERFVLAGPPSNARAAGARAHCGRTPRHSQRTRASSPGRRARRRATRCRDSQGAWPMPWGLGVA